MKEYFCDNLNGATPTIDWLVFFVAFHVPSVFHSRCFPGPAVWLLEYFPPRIRALESYSSLSNNISDVYSAFFFVSYFNQGA